MEQADQTEDEFVKILVKECKDYVVASNRKCDIWDEGVLKDLFQRGVNTIKLKEIERVQSECKIMQFTVSGGRHSVLERPLSDENSRPFLVKTPAIIGY